MLTSLLSRPDLPVFTSVVGLSLAQFVPAGAPPPRDNAQGHVSPPQNPNPQPQPQGPGSLPRRVVRGGRMYARLVHAAVGALLAWCAAAAERRLDAFTSGGPGGRGWGGAAAEGCALGVTTQHPTGAGFRVTMRRWSRGATLRWQFDEPVALLQHWGSVRPLPQTAGDMSSLSFSLRGEHVPKMRHNHSQRTDHWGFVLAQPYAGRWRTTCSLVQHKHAAPHDSQVYAPPLPPPPPPQPTASSMGRWVGTLGDGLGKLTATAAAATAAMGLKMGLAPHAASSTRPSAATNTEDESSTAMSGNAGRRGGGKRAGGGKARRRAAARRRRRKQKKG
jgi:hypothetical protein